MNENQNVDAHKNNHTDPATATETEVGERRGYASYREYLRVTDQRPYLSEQRDILGAIIFDTEGCRFTRELTTKSFCHRNYADFRYEKGNFELLADVAFLYWDQHGEAPGEAIYDLIAEMPEGVRHVAQNMERRQRAIEEAHDRERRDHERAPLGLDPEADDDRKPDTRTTFWDRMMICIFNYLEQLKPNDRPPNSQRPTRGEKRKARNQLVMEMTRAGKPRREIIEATGLSTSRISQIVSKMPSESDV